MAADILRFSTEKDLSVTHAGKNIASELLEALGELAVAQDGRLAPDRRRNEAARKGVHRGSCRPLVLRRDQGKTGENHDTLTCPTLYAISPDKSLHLDLPNTQLKEGNHDEVSK